jgi:hypothetical protein
MIIIIDLTEQFKYPEMMKGMRYGQLPGRSPEGKSRNYIKCVNADPLYHINCLQINKTKILYDDIYYQTILISKIFLIGQVVHCEKVVSQRGMSMINTRIKDSTGACNVSFYFSEKAWQICEEKGSYVKIAANIKCGGVVYRP